MKRICIAFVLCLLMLGCVKTSTLKLDPQALSGQQAISKGDVEAVVSQKKAKVTIQPLTGTYTSKDLPTIVVSVYSDEQTFDFSPEDIQVFLDGDPHALAPYDKLVEGIKRKEKKALKDLEMEQDKRMRGTGSDPEAVRYAKEKYQIDVQAVEKETKKSIRAIESKMLKKRTVREGREYSGRVALDEIPDPAQPHEVKVVVTAAGEKHEFLLNHLTVK